MHASVVAVFALMRVNGLGNNVMNAGRSIINGGACDQLHKVLYHMTADLVR
ncbi:MAG: hypothetical protein ACRER8_02885 [Pseudomonas sp.]|uniref:hypothetical protein n=1 Tax=Pseudomonas sp. TaxID=306 RepID=UPI003D6E1DC5